MRHWYEIDDAVLPAQGQPAVLLELGAAREIEAHRLLSGTRLFPEQLADGHHLITPEQMLRLVDNAARLIPGADTAFLFGHRLLPGHDSALAMALMTSTHLEDALQTLHRARRLASPLLTPRLHHSAEGLEIQWVDSIGLGRQRPFLVEAWCTAVTSLGNWLSGGKLQWQYDFRHARPAYIEQYEVHLGGSIRFDAACDSMRIAPEALRRPWPKASASGKAQALRQLDLALSALPQAVGFREMLAAQLAAQLQKPLKLERTAAALNMSPASFKRKLSKHRCSYQDLLDELRRDVCIRLFRERGYSNEQAAEYLNFNDVNNFRRSFKRWTGVTPSEFRALWCAGDTAPSA